MHSAKVIAGFIFFNNRTPNRLEGYEEYSPYCKKMFTFGDNSSSLSVGVFSQTIASTVKESMEGKGRK